LRVAPDDDVYRVNAVWLGPRGLTFPWTARYLAYATWLVTFLAILLIEAVVPPLSVSVPPVWEFSITTLFTYAVMGFVDHERPVQAVWQTFLVDLGTPRPAAKNRPTRIPAKVRVHARPRHDRRLTRAYFAGTTHTVPTHAARYAGSRPSSSRPSSPLPPRSPGTGHDTGRARSARGPAARKSAREPSAGKSAVRETTREPAGEPTGRESAAGRQTTGRKRRSPRRAPGRGQR
jgi:hypothetical protein